jgi:hypothetical protein
LFFGVFYFGWYGSVVRQSPQGDVQRGTACGRACECGVLVSWRIGDVEFVVRLGLLECGGDAVVIVLQGGPERVVFAVDLELDVCPVLNRLAVDAARNLAVQAVVVRT